MINFNLLCSFVDYMYCIGWSGCVGEVGLVLLLIDYEDFYYFKIIEKKNKFCLECEEVFGYILNKVNFDVV